MRQHPRGYTFVVLLIAMALVAWLTVQSMRRSKSQPSKIEQQLQEQGIQLPPGQAVTPEAAAQAIESKIHEYEHKDLDRKEQAIDANGQ